MAAVTVISCEEPGESSWSLERGTLSCFSCSLLQELSPDCSTAWQGQLSRGAVPRVRMCPIPGASGRRMEQPLGVGEELVPAKGGGGCRQPCHRLASGQEKRHLALKILEVFSNLMPL